MVLVMLKLFFPGWIMEGEVLVQTGGMVEEASEIERGTTSGTGTLMDSGEAEIGMPPGTDSSLVMEKLHLGGWGYQCTVISVRCVL